MSAFIIIALIEWCKVIDVVSTVVSIYIRFVQFLHDMVNFCCSSLRRLLLLEILGTLHFNTAVDAGYLVGLNLEAFMLKFSHREGVFGPI